MTSFLKRYLWLRKAHVVHAGLLIWLDHALLFTMWSQWDSENGGEGTDGGLLRTYEKRGAIKIS